MTGTTPMRLTWRLASPIVVGAYPLHLDALLAFAMGEEGTHQEPPVWDINRELALPLGKEVRGELSCWMSSALVPTSPSEHSLRLWTRKSDPYDYAQRLKAGQIDVRTKWPLKPHGLKFDTQRGIFRQMYKFFPVRQVQEVQAWCVGDMDRITELLAPESGFVTYIGAKSRMGYGRVTEFDIQHDEAAHDMWARRVLPWETEGCVEVEAATAPPYWDLKNRRTAYVHPDLFN